jgi:hypothetical protein
MLLPLFFPYSKISSMFDSFNSCLILIIQLFPLCPNVSPNVFVSSVSQHLNQYSITLMLSFPVCPSNSFWTLTFIVRMQRKLHP